MSEKDKAVIDAATLLNQLWEDDDSSELDIQAAELALSCAVTELTGVGGMTGITKTPGVCGGSACIAGTRIPVWLVVRWEQLEQLTALHAPHLSAEDIKAALKYAEEHPEEIAQDMKENEDAMCG